MIKILQGYLRNIVGSLFLCQIIMNLYEFGFSNDVNKNSERVPPDATPFEVYAVSV